ncbi:MAG: CDP-diacylglycerol--serine O-phosphatidyltransferase [Bacteroidetes bacterium]|nr:CDP-diacylglycerol--serine O-phosphatidyltransferase [Bacteroidota bacterium]
MNVKAQIPNILTIFNLIAGLVSITFVFDGNLVMASLFIFIAGVFDFLDGTAARVLNARSPLGKELDSLSDLVSFGVAPGMIIYHILSLHCALSCNSLERMHIIPYFALLIPVCSAIRLGKFNLDTRQEEYFIGLPTPANAMFFAAIPLVITIQPHIYSILNLDFLITFFSNSRILVILTILFSYLLISDLPLFSMKFKTFDWKSNSIRYIFLIISFAMIFLFTLDAIPLIIASYILFSLFFYRHD